ncbi:MAG: MOSC domain-containing protein [Chloroflexi bacterium]|nr:MOSC domain-containing protein [Chloroflexota bacterium]
MEQGGVVVRRGTVVAVQVAEAASAPMTPVEQVRAVAGRGLEGDRYFNDGGTWSREAAAGQQVTLIEAEAIEAARGDAGVQLEARDSRRNIVTRGVSLNELVGKAFRVGGATLWGVGLCEPCSHMVRLSGKEILRSLVHRGGLRADIVIGGTVRVGDPVEPD